MDERQSWFKVTIHHPPLASEAVSAVMFEEGASAVWEDLPDKKGRQVLRAGFDKNSATGLRERLPGIMTNFINIFESSPNDFELHMEMEEAHDWAEKWKEGLEPIIINELLAIAPTWWPDADLPKAANILRIDPGLAFGSGHHASTFMCLELLSEHAHKSERILDVGSGSGILSLAAAALNPKAKISALDNDPDTIAVAEENALVNKLSGRIDFTCGPLSSLEPGFDLAVANITLSPLVELAPDISRLTNDKGIIILSGLLESQLEEISNIYESLAWKIKSKKIQNEWAAISFGKNIL